MTKLSWSTPISLGFNVVANGDDKYVIDLGLFKRKFGYEVSKFVYGFNIYTDKVVVLVKGRSQINGHLITLYGVCTVAKTEVLKGYSHPAPELIPYSLAGGFLGSSLEKAIDLYKCTLYSP